MSEKKHIDNRRRVEDLPGLSPDLRMYIQNLNDNVSWSSSSDSSSSDSSSSDSSSSSSVSSSSVSVSSSSVSA